MLKIKISMLTAALAFILSVQPTAAWSNNGTVLLIHGLWGGPDSWAEYADHLRSHGWFEGCLLEFKGGSTVPETVPRDRRSRNLTGSTAWEPTSVCSAVPANAPVFFRVVFRDNDGQSFRMQGNQVAAAVQWARSLTGDSKVTLISHSMGGLASRAYLQASEYTGDVETLVTVATPHLGSLLPFLEEQELGSCRPLARFVGKDLGAPAVRLLAPDSPEMVSLNIGGAPYSALPTDVRYANVVGTYDPRGSPPCYINVKKWLASWNSKLKEYLDPTAAHSLVSPDVFANWSDGIVPVVSQYLKGSPVAYALDVEVETVQGFHSDLPGMKAVWNVVEQWLPLRNGTSPRECGAIELALLVDSSGSMKQSDPQELRKGAVSLLLYRAPRNTSFSVVDFDDSATTLVSRSTNVDEIRRTIDRIDASGGTNITRALRTGYSSLATGTGGKAAILFTDGQSSQRGGTEGYQQENIPVHVVGLGPGVDTDYLQRLAASTNGVYMHATNAGDLAEIFDHVISELACEGTIFSNDGSVHPGEVIEHRFLVDNTINQLTVRVTWPGSRIDVELVNPEGSKVGEKVASGPTYQIVSASKPQAGSWTARVIGTQVENSGEPYTIRAGGPSDLRLSVTQDSHDPSLLNVTVVENTSGSHVTKTWSRVRSPNGETSQGPNLASSGFDTWSLAVPAITSGIYKVTAGFKGRHIRGGDWSREFTRTVVIGEGVVPWRGRVTSRSGIHVEIDRGFLHGVRPGAKVLFGPEDEPIAIGLVMTTEPQSCNVKITQRLGSGLPEAGGLAVFDKKSLGESFMDGAEAPDAD